MVPVNSERHGDTRDRSQRPHPRRLAAPILVAGFLAFGAACSQMRPTTPASGSLTGELATGTALVARKYTEAAELTKYPMTAPPAGIGPFATMAWTPSPGEITAIDSGKSFDIWITVRVSIILDESQYPRENLVEGCVPQDAIGRVSNIPAVAPHFYVVRYEGVKLGRCVIRNGQFQVVINIVNRP